MLPAGDTQLVQILDAALAETAQRSGDWLVCRPGCTQCCIGVFAISQLDAMRLRAGMDDLCRTDPQRAAAVRERARGSVERLAADFPGDAESGILGGTEEDEARFESFANDEVCPALDPDSGRCDLYSSRPIICRTFGPPVRSGGGLGVCELCYQGATPEEIAACEMPVDPDGLEPSLIEEAQQTSGKRGLTLVAYALAG